MPTLKAHERVDVDKAREIISSSPAHITGQWINQRGNTGMSFDRKSGIEYAYSNTDKSQYFRFIDGSNMYYYIDGDERFTPASALEWPPVAVKVEVGDPEPIEREAIEPERVHRVRRDEDSDEDRISVKREATMFLSDDEEREQTPSPPPRKPRHASPEKRQPKRDTPRPVKRETMEAGISAEEVEDRMPVTPKRKREVEAEHTKTERKIVARKTRGEAALAEETRPKHIVRTQREPSHSPKKLHRESRQRSMQEETSEANSPASRPRQRRRREL